MSDVKTVYGPSVIIQAPKIDNLENFRVRFRAAKARRGLTLAQLAEACGVSVSTVGAWSQGKNFPEVEAQQKLAESLNVSVQFLIHGIPVTHEDFTDHPEGITYAKPRGKPDGSRPPFSGIVNEVNLNPRYTSSGKAPTRQQVESYLKAYLDLAQQVPGGIEHAFIEITEALSMEKIRRRLDKSAARP